MLFLQVFLSIYCGLGLAAPLLLPSSPSCANLDAAFDTDCYRALNLGDFLINATTGWNATRGRACHVGDNASYCCRSTDTSWAACFVRQAINLAGKPSCDSTSSASCPTSSFAIVPEVASENQRKYQYVLQNIYCKLFRSPTSRIVCRLNCDAAVYTLFTTWESALVQGITTQTNTDISDLVSEVDPKGIHSTLAPDVVQAYLLGLPLLAAPAAVNMVPSQALNQVNPQAQAMLSGLQGAPSVAQALLVNSSATAYPIETSGVEEYLSTNTTIATLNGFINQALTLIMKDLNIFVHFTSSGKFSGAQNLTIGSQAGLDVALQSLVTSTARDDSNYVNLIRALGLGIAIP